MDAAHVTDEVLPSAPAPEEKPAITWTAQEDAQIMWSILCCPFSEYTKSTSLASKTPKQIEDRYLEIIFNQEKSQRVLDEVRGDIIGFRTTSWTKYEYLSLIRLVQNNKKTNNFRFLTKFPMLFHPSRTNSSINATSVRLHSREKETYDLYLKQFHEYEDKVHEEAAGLNLLPFPGLDNPEPVIRNLVNDQTDVEKVEVIPTECTFEAIRARAKEKMNKRTFAAMVGPGNIRLLEKARVTFGRQSPKKKPDIDLSDLGLQSVSRIHVTISIRTDMNFYADVIGKGIMVNGIVYRKGTCIRIKDRDLIDIGGACFVFLENKELMKALRSV